LFQKRSSRVTSKKERSGASSYTQHGPVVNTILLGVAFYFLFWDATRYSAREHTILPSLANRSDIVCFEAHDAVSTLMGCHSVDCIGIPSCRDFRTGSHVCLLVVVAVPATPISRSSHPFGARPSISHSGVGSSWIWIFVAWCHPDSPFHMSRDDCHHVSGRRTRMTASNTSNPRDSMW